MKPKIIKRYNKVISILLSVLGFGSVLTFTGCDEEEVSPVEYGTPFATFIVKGKVNSEQTSSPVSNIRVIMGYDSTLTDESGNYELSNTDFPTDQTFELSFKDIDGETNGSLQSLDTTITFTNPEFTDGDDSWYSGETEKEIDIELKDE